MDDDALALRGKKSIGDVRWLCDNKNTVTYAFFENNIALIIEVDKITALYYSVPIWAKHI